MMNINPLLRSLRPPQPSPPARDDVDAEEIAFAISNVFADRLSPAQTAVLLYNLSITGLEQRPDVLAACAAAMRAAAAPVDPTQLRKVVLQRKAGRNKYEGGLCDIVGTGGDHHSTFNISTASSIIASSLLLIAKHGNRASTSRSGSADVLSCIALPKTASSDTNPLHPQLTRITPSTLAPLYARTNFAFLFAPNFHTGLAHVAQLRKQLPHPTIFNLLGPLTNPAEAALEARCVGVRAKSLVPHFAEALRLAGARKALVVCGDEDLDEISIAGPTHCARLVDGEVRRFLLTPEDFGVPRHPLAEVSPGLTPEENAAIMLRLVGGEMSEDDPILHFVLINVAALFVVSGVTDGVASAFDGDEGQVVTEVGPGGGRWKEGVRLAKVALKSKKALEMLRSFIVATNE